MICQKCLGMDNTCFYIFEYCAMYIVDSDIGLYDCAIMKGIKMSKYNLFIYV